MGYVGSCLAATLVESGLEVTGVDKDEKTVSGLREGVSRFRDPGLPEMIAQGVDTGRLRFTTDYGAVSDSDVVLISVGTPTRDHGRLVDDQLRGCCEELARHLRPGQLVILKSTIPRARPDDWSFRCWRAAVSPVARTSGWRSARSVSPRAPPSTNCAACR
ncbi:hypothetical protein [Nocardiopsis alba]|uniref:hypothetical protein n=1 Tax=Nocardiopsis alba TaxID=53437 RepID=UPI0030B840AA